jgi:ABC-type spermidine/putrescine transport system permease subunit II
MGFDLWSALGVSQGVGLAAIGAAVGLVAAMALMLRRRQSRTRITGLGLGDRR